MKKYFLIISVFFLLSCDGFEDLSIIGQPDVKVIGVKDGEIELALSIEIENPNSKSFKVKEAAFDIYINDALMGSTHMKKAIKIEGNSSEMYTFPVNVNINGEGLSLNLILNTIFQSRIKLRVEGNVKAGSLLYNRKIPVEFEENISL
jgi:LEA14-like dessication related protein